jgi:hypothetical protein
LVCSTTIGSITGEGAVAANEAEEKPTEIKDPNAKDEIDKRANLIGFNALPRR